MTIRIDKAQGQNHLASIKNTEKDAMLQGQVVELGEYVEKDVWGATKVKALNSGKLVIHASSDSAGKCEDEFTLKENRIGRAYYPVTGQVFTIPKTMFTGTPKVKDFVEPTVGAVTWAKATAKPTAHLHAEVIEECVYGGKDCFVIHIYA